jgi:hypothetical protein
VCDEEGQTVGSSSSDVEGSSLSDDGEGEAQGQRKANMIVSRSCRIVGRSKNNKVREEGVGLGIISLYW